MKYNILFILALSVIISSCEPDDVSVDARGVQWFTSQDLQQSFYLEIGEKLDLFDVSQNALSHKWIIEEGSFFLDRSFTDSDSVYENFIISNELESKEANVSVLFQKPGLKKIRLANTYTDSVSWFAPGTDTLKATNESGVWTIDTTFVVDVFDKLNPVFQVMKAGEVIATVTSEDAFYSNGDSIDTSGWPTIDVEVGGTLEFIDLTEIGRPTARTWDINIGEAVTSTNDSAASVVYTKLGLSVGGIFTSRRAGDNVPSARAAKVIPIKVNGIPSSEPFVVDTNAGANENDGVLTFKVTGEIAAFNGASQIANFTVHATNTNFDQDLTIESIGINPDDATGIDITLGEEVYNTDVITISYIAGASPIQSLDTRELKDFSDLAVTFAAGGSNVLEPSFAGFENARVAGNIEKKGDLEQYWVGNDNVPHRIFTRTTDMAFVGEASLKFETTEAGIAKDYLLQGTKLGATTTAHTPGAYEIKISIYIEPGNTMTTLQYSLFKYVTEPIWTFDITNTPRGEWVTLASDNIQETPEAIAGDDRFDFKIIQADNPADAIIQKLYVDDVQMLPRELRPQ